MSAVEKIGSEGASARSPYFTEEHEALRDQVRPLRRDRDQASRKGPGRKRASCRARFSGRWARWASSASAIRPNMAARRWTRWRRRLRRRTRPLDLLGRRDHRARPYRHGLRPHRQCRQQGPARPADAGDRRWREDRRRRRHRARRGLGREGHPHHRAPRGRQLCAERRKVYITNGVHADLYCVAAKTDLSAKPSQSVSIFLVEKGTPGFRVARELDKHGWRSSDTAELVFEIAASPPRTCSGRRAAASTRS